MMHVENQAYFPAPLIWTIQQQSQFWLTLQYDKQFTLQDLYTEVTASLIKFQSLFKGQNEAIKELLG